MDLGGWLRSLGLEQYEAAFRENAIDESVLLRLTAEDLKEIGVRPVGHRRKFLDAIAALRSDTTPNATSPAALPTRNESSPKDAAERRQVTVMFSDLVGSTALSARMDPEDLRELISAYQNCVAEAVRRFGGFVARYMGDGMLVYFGYPEAHEDDAERAVRAGLESIAAVIALETAASLQTRVGIATGLVVVGDLTGSGEAQERGIVGETPNLAARLQGLAEPNTVVIAEPTRRLLGNLFELRDLGARDLKGVAEPVRAWAALRASTVESRFEALHPSALTALVGREEETELLLRRWSRAKSGDGQVVLISGEAGIGKSRLTASLLERLAPEPHTCLRYFCSPHHQDSAMYPSITQLERVAGFRREDTTEQRLDKLETVLALGTNDLSEIVPLLAYLLSIPTGGRYPPLNLTPQKLKEKTIHAQLAQVEGLAARQPVLMVFEDIHWSDPTTLESVDLLIDRVPARRVMVIIIFRPEFTPPWVGRSHVTMLTLNRLAPRQRAEMIMGVTGGKSLPGEIADQIIDRTDGVPLFIEELTKSVVESGLVTEAGDLYTMTGPLMPLAIPTTLHASLLARLDRLAPTRQVAQIGAALGRSFSHELIRAVAGLPQQQLDDALVQLARAELVFRRGTPPDAEYTFKHALVQDAAYSTLLRSHRQQLHGRITTTLESQFPEIVAAQPQLMAQHCAQAGLNEKAVGYWLKAGQQAVARSAMTEAAAQLQKGLDLLASQPDSSWRRQQELDLLLALGRALIAAKGYAAPAVGETYARAGILAEQLDRSDCLVPLLRGQWAFHLTRSELRRTLSLAERIERIGEAQDNTAVRLLGHLAHGMNRFWLGEFVAAGALFEQCHGLNDPAHRAGYAAYGPMLAYLAWTLTYLGYIDQGRSRINEALTEARRLGHAYPLAFVLAVVAFIESATGSPHEAHRYAEEMVAIGDEHGFALVSAWGHVHLGWSLTALGQAAGGLNLITNGLAMHRATGAVLMTPWMLMKLAAARHRLGQSVNGLKCLAEAVQLIEATDERCEEAELHRVRGDLLNATGDQAGAEQSYHQALTVAQRQSAKLFELRTATSLARLWRDQGRRAEARDLLTPIYNCFTEGFDTPVLKEAKMLLDQLECIHHQECRVPPPAW